MTSLILSLLEAAVDPMFLFCLGCVLTPLVVARETLTRADVVAYFTEPSMLLSLLAVPVCGVLATLLDRRYRGGSSGKGSKGGKGKKPRATGLTYGERARARWYLLNGLIIHILMDGCVGVFKTSRLFALNYAKLDHRYGAALGTFQGSAVHVVSLCELFLKGPLCVLLYFLFYTHGAGRGWREVAEFFTCVTQAYGTVVYLGQEAISGGTNLEVDWALDFSAYHILYFWFAIFFGCLLYLIVPCVLGARSAVRLARALH